MMFNFYSTNRKLRFSINFLFLMMLAFSISPATAMFKEPNENENVPHSLSVQSWAHSTIKYELLNYPIKRKIKDLSRNKGYILELGNNTFDSRLAVFKPRQEYKMFGEVMSYEMSVQLFGLDHTIPPTVSRAYQGRVGVFQHYVKPEFELSNQYTRAIIEANRFSYADLQTFLFSVAMGDVNEDGIIPWKNTSNKINFTYVDSEYIFSDTTEYGCQSPSLRSYLDKYDSSYPKDVFNSKYTKFYNPTTLGFMKKIDESSILKVWEYTDKAVGASYINSEHKKISIDRVMGNIKKILEDAT